MLLIDNNECICFFDIPIEVVHQQPRPLSAMSMSPPNQRNFTAKRTKSPSPSSPLIQDSNSTFFKMDVGIQTKSPSHSSSSVSTTTTGTTPSMLKSEKSAICCLPQRLESTFLKKIQTSLG